MRRALLATLLLSGCATAQKPSLTPRAPRAMPPAKEVAKVVVIPSATVVLKTAPPIVLEQTIHCNIPPRLHLADSPEELAKIDGLLPRYNRLLDMRDQRKARGQLRFKTLVACMAAHKITVTY